MAEFYLYIPPDQRGFSITMANGSVSTRVAGGRNRTRLDFLGASYIAQVRWTVGPAERNFIVSFIEDLLEDGTIPFDIDLYANGDVNGPLQRVEAQLVPGTFRQVGTSGSTHILSASLEVLRDIEGRSDRAATALLLAATEGQIGQFENLLDQTVNEVLPNQAGLPPSP